MEFNELKLENPIPTKKINQLIAAGVNNVNDMLRLYPKWYCDYRKIINIKTAENGKRIAVKAVLLSTGRRTGKKKTYTTAKLRDVISNAEFRVIWFNQYTFNKIYELKGKEIIVGGVFKNDEYGMCITEPDIFTSDIENYPKIFAIHKKIKNMAVEYFDNILRVAIEQYNEPDPFDEKMREYFQIISEKEMIKYIHTPENENQIKMANKRLIFESLYPLAHKMAEDSKNSDIKSTFIPYKLDNFNKFLAKLPYELTEDQKNVITEFGKSARAGKRVNALVQGDVGCGKTIVAFSLMIMMADNGYQAVLMAPTGILAEQHYEELKSYVEPLGLNTVLLKNNMKVAEKREALKKIESGEANFVVGTHSVISDKVIFNNLGITIVDEEHKFGVTQRENLSKKAADGVHNISMSATPIPRSLALTLYGNTMDIFSIESMPNGRKPVRTEVVKSDISAFKFMQLEVEKGHQCYIVCPLIGDPMLDYSDSDDEKEKPTSVEKVYKTACEFFKGQNVKIEMMTGKMKDEEKQAIKEKFYNNECQILIATTIIEVGINVPNATVITIMNAERFGLAGLHQLRGRVGRSNLQSYCILRSNDKDNPRLNVMEKTTNGFEIAEEDLNLRGTGDFLGTKQSGESKDVMLMIKYPTFYSQIKKYILDNNLV